MPELPRLTTDAATPFLKCEAFRLLAFAYKRGSASPHAAEACDALEQLDAVFRNATSIKGRP